MPGARSLKCPQWWQAAWSWPRRHLDATPVRPSTGSRLELASCRSKLAAKGAARALLPAFIRAPVCARDEIFPFFRAHDGPPFLPAYSTHSGARGPPPPARGQRGSGRGSNPCCASGTNFTGRVAATRKPSRCGARVSGYIDRIAVQRKATRSSLGDLVCFVIDPRPYKARYEQARPAQLETCAGPRTRPRRGAGPALADAELKNRRPSSHNRV